MTAMERISVVGTSGSGKSTFSRRLAEILEVPRVELDAIFHQPGWTGLSDEEFTRQVDEATAGPRWVVDGNYRRVSMEGPVWARADTVIWLDPTDSRLMRQITGRTLRRWATREELWNGNREPLLGPFRWNPEQSVIRWSWTTRKNNRRRYSEAMADPRWDHMTFHRLRTPEEVEAFLAAVVTENS